MRAFNPAYIESSPLGIFYLRWPLPSTLHPARKPSTIKISLRTRHRREALRLARYLGQMADQIIQDGQQSGMRYDQIRQLVQTHFQTALRKRLETFGERGQLSEKDRDIISFTRDVYAQAVETDSVTLTDEMSDETHEVDRFAARYGIDLADNSELRLMLQQEIHKANRDFWSQVLKVNEGFERYELSPTAEINGTEIYNVKKNIDTICLRNFIDKYTTDKEAGRNWSAKTTLEKHDHFKLLFEIVGEDIPINKLDGKVAIHVKDVLLRFPKNRTKNPLTRGKSLTEALEVSDVAKIESATINKYLQSYNDLFGWGVRTAIINANPFTGLTIRQNADRSPEKRTRFSDAQVQLIISECVNPNSRIVKKPYQKWGVLIAAYSGMRLNEICQLHLSDINDGADLPFFDVNDNDDKQVKSAAARRLVPIHSELIRHGFIDYVSQRRKYNCKKLFDELRYDPKNGWGRALSRWFNDRYMRDLGMTEKSLVFHSFRHSVITSMLRGGVAAPIAQSVVGHAREGVTHKNYFTSGYDMPQLKAAIETINYFGAR